MTEQEWLEADSPEPLLAFLEREAVTLVDRVPPEHRETMRRHLIILASERKRRLLGCAFARQVWPLLADERSRHAVEVAERFADGTADDGELGAAVTDATQARDEARIDRRAGDRTTAQAARSAATAAMMAARFDIRAAADECAVVGMTASLFPTLGDAEREQAALVRDIVGNPFRPPVIEPSWLSWNGGAAVALARTIYEERRFEDMPVLADALEEAGCRDEEVLGHLRGPGPHARGCLVIDLMFKG